MFSEFDTSDWVSITVEPGLALAGLWLLWRRSPCQEAGAREVPGGLPEWPISFVDFGLFFLGAFFFSYLCLAVALKIVGMPGKDDSGLQLIGLQAFAQLGMIGWCLGFRHRGRSFRLYVPTIAPKSAFPAAAATFLIAMAVVGAVSMWWVLALQMAGYPPEPQDTVEFFTKPHSSLVRLAFVFITVIGAPVAEELIFRGGLFHYARSRLPRWGALLLPACIFAALHGSLTAFVPLAALAVILSLAYERTGNLAVPMVAHGLFNLHTLAVILIGAGS